MTPVSSFFVLLDSRSCQVGVSILKLSEEKLLQMDFDEMIQYLQKLPDPSILSCEKLIPTAMQISISLVEMRSIFGDSEGDWTYS